MAIAKRKNRGHAILAAQSAVKGNEPMLQAENYNSSLGHLLRWYTENTTEKQRRKYAIEYFAKRKMKTEVLAINKANDFDIRILAILCRLDDREQPLSDHDKSKIMKYATEFVEKFSKQKEEPVVADKPATNVISIQQRINDRARDLAGDIEAAIDDFCLNRTSDFSAKNFLRANEVSAPIAKKIGEFYVGLSGELHEAIEGKCPQLKEGYSHWSKRELKKFAEFVDTIISDCMQMVQTAKATRAPRKRKPTPPSKVVSKMKYMKEFAELNLKSCKAEDIVSSSELWVYNTKYRRVQVYKAEYGSLNVKGTTVIGFSVKESLSYTLRKPEEFFKNTSIGKRALNAAIKKLTTKPSTPNGRVNEECILLGAF